MILFKQTPVEVLVERDLPINRSVGFCLLKRTKDYDWLTPDNWRMYQPIRIILVILLVILIFLKFSQTVTTQA